MGSSDAPAPAAGGADRERLTALLLAVLPSQDAEVAAAIVAEYGSLGRVLASSAESLRRVTGAMSPVPGLIVAVRELMLHVLSREIEERPLLSTSGALQDYLRVAMAHAPAEQFRILYLDASNHLLRDEVATVGTFDGVTVYPREIIRRALELDAASLILAHNHPGGNAKPSATDIATTRRVASACREVEIRLLDHVVVARSGWSSMYALGLL